MTRKNNFHFNFKILKLSYFIVIYKGVYKTIETFYIRVIFFCSLFHFLSYEGKGDEFFFFVLKNGK